MTDTLTQLLILLAALGTIAAGIIGSMKLWTSLTERAISVWTVVIMVGLTILAHMSGFVPMIADTSMKGTILAAIWGLIVAVGGHGLTSSSALSMFKSPGN